MKRNLLLLAVIAVSLLVGTSYLFLEVTSAQQKHSNQPTFSRSAYSPSLVAAKPDKIDGYKPPRYVHKGVEKEKVAKRQGGETCDDAYAISVPFNSTGYTCDNVNDYDEVCPYSGSTSPDVVYSYTPAADEVVNIDLYGSSYDTKVYVYEDICQSPYYACNDDYHPDYTSAIFGLDIYSGHTYYIVVDGYGGACGDYLINITYYEECDVVCPPGGIPEGEPDCYDDYADDYNGGCNCDPYVFQDISCGDTICGTSGTYLYYGSNYRDTDWFRLELTEVGTITWSAVAEFPVLISIIDAGSEDCVNYEILGNATADMCDTATLSMCVPAGVYWLWVSPSVFEGYPCGLEYVAEIECDSAPLKPTYHSFFWTADDEKMWDDYYLRLVDRKLGDEYQDLELVHFSCHSGGFAKKAHNFLTGQWSVTTSTREDLTCTDLKSTDRYKEVNGQQVEGLNIDDPDSDMDWYHGFMPQWVKRLLESSEEEVSRGGPPTKEVWRYANNRNPVRPAPYPEREVYASSGVDADTFRLHGGDSSNHAIMFNGKPGGCDDTIFPVLYDALKHIGYTDETIDFCWDNDTTPPNVDRTATEQDLIDALDDLKTKLDEHPGEEKALIIVSGHGGRELRREEGRVHRNEKATGAGYEMDDNQMDIPLDSSFVDYFLEEVTRDDTLTYRVFPPQFFLTTKKEWGSGDIEVVLNGYPVGHIYMSNSDSGGDYELEIPDDVISDIAPSLETDTTLYIQFNLLSGVDSFLVASVYDFQDSLYPYGHYGIGVGVSIGSEISEILLGDANGDGLIDIGDVMYLINYLFIGGPAPIPLDAGDANCDGVVDIGDVMYLINYLFIDGPAPCEGKGVSPGYGTSELYKGKAPFQIGLSTPTISKEGIFNVPVIGKFDVDVSAVQLEIKYDPEEITLLEPVLTPRSEGLTIYSSAYGSRNLQVAEAKACGYQGIQKIGILDLSGEHYIPAGSGALLNLRIKGSDLTSSEITQAILVDRDAQKIPVEILSKMKESKEDIIAGKSAVPQEFSLSQNYPNPFNPETEISYALPKDCHVQLVIYNVLGQKVKVLVDEHQTAGFKKEHWDSKDDKGKELASGIYFYKIQTGDFSQSRKMVLLK